MTSASSLSTDEVDTSRTVIVSVQVGRARDYEWLGRRLRSSIDKRPVAGRVRVLATQLDGDEQADPDHHGGYDKAVYAYASEDLRWWAQKLDRPALDPGRLRGEPHDDRHRPARRGDRRAVARRVRPAPGERTPHALLEAGYADAGPAIPQAFPPADLAPCYGFSTGEVWAGAPVTVLHTPDHGITARVFALYVGERQDADRVLSAPELAAHWQQWAGHRTVWHVKDERELGDA